MTDQPVFDDHVKVRFNMDDFLAATPMGTQVVNVRNEPCDIYIGRGTWNGQSGKWGNQFSHIPSKYMITLCKDREEAVDRYAHWLYDEIRHGRITAHDLAPLAGKRLGCWCAPKACHGHILAVAAESAAEHLAERSQAIHKAILKGVEEFEKSK